MSAMGGKLSFRLSVEITEVAIVDSVARVARMARRYQQLASVLQVKAGLAVTTALQSNHA
jgi:predicted MarR family transcription regulator